MLIRNCRPVSKRKRFELLKILTTAKVASEKRTIEAEGERASEVKPTQAEEKVEDVREKA